MSRNTLNSLARRIAWLAAGLLLAGCAPAVFGPPPTPTFFEIMPLPSVEAAQAIATETPAPVIPTTISKPGIGGPDLVASVRTSVAPPLCFDAHSHVGALVSVVNNGSSDAGPFMVEVDGIWQAVPQGLAAGEYTSLWFDGSIYKTPWETMTVTVDAANQVAESDESNNMATAFVATLTPPLPCLTATGLP